ncbi:hypothetical protein B0J11DRAFT_540952 [Dendryphion nanum]|uniref:Uncharacterized protein n=1 Tax=Dendryphion nanum TaxID=256645 RepID=A0A9P9D6B4_9PLEO|nr:hypothetical protein B0J11DRAFT_540952 [Dendryphion nanum]
MAEVIRRVNGYEHNAYTYYPILIVGAGASGIAMACRLKDELGFDQFRIFDRQAGIGGTWWINRYPGVACDIPAPFYSFSFAQNPNWTSFHPRGPEIVQYYHDVCQRYKITDKVELNTDIEQCRWLKDEQLWEVTLKRLVAGMGDISSKERAKIVKEKGESAVVSETEVVRARVVISGVGGLVEPKGWPNEIPGIEKFKGPVFHSARWDESVDFTDKKVVVVGTGCSSAQLVPRLPNAPYNAKSVTQLMRSPPWVAPSPDAPKGDEWWAKNGPRILNRYPGLLQLIRFGIFVGTETAFFKLFPNTERAAKGREVYEAQLIKRMQRIVPEKYWEILTPDYGVGCKRRIFDKKWYKSLNDPKIELTTQPLARVNETSVVIGPGRTYPPSSKEDFPGREVEADIIVLANGFDTTRWLHPLKVVGLGGKDLVEVMDERGGPQAYQGTAMDGFPNFFMLFGPNTATGHSSVVLAVENMVNFSLKFIKPILKGEVSTVEVKHEAEVAFTADLQKSLKNTVWGSGGCQSWYVHDGWNGTVYPYSQIDFWRRCTFPRWSDWNIQYTKKGIAAKRRRVLKKTIVLALGIIGAYRFYQSGLGVADVKELMKQLFQSIVGQILLVWSFVKDRLLTV